jgi:hypothetical protein
MSYHYTMLALHIYYLDKISLITPLLIDLKFIEYDSL